MSKLETVELFAGIGGFRIAADRCNMETIWANDNSPKACAVYRDVFGNGELREGDINQLLDDIPPHDILTAGFPCQPFSSAGKKQGIRDSRGTLFQRIATVLERHQPAYFVLENVKRLLAMEQGSHFATILSVLADLDYWLEWRLLNALHFGLPQNRQRVFIVGIHKRKLQSQGLREGQLPPIRLASKEDIGNLSSNALDKLLHLESWKSITEHGKQISAWGMASDGHFFATTLDTFTHQSTLVPLKSVLECVVPPAFDFTESTIERLKESKPVHKYVEGVEILSNQGGGARMGYTVFGVNGVAPTLTSTTSRHYERYKVGDRYRRLTNVEYARIQGFPDNHCKAVSIYDQYALIGNAVPPPMATWVLNRLTGTGSNITKSQDRHEDVKLNQTQSTQLPFTFA